MKIISRLGQGLPAIVKGDISANDVSDQEGLLEQWYTNNCAMATFTSYLARLSKQIVHRYPHMHILELGSEMIMGVTTSTIIYEIGPKFASYTITGPPFSSAETSVAWPENYREKISFKPSDISKDLVEQGFPPASYDIIIISLSLNATGDPDHTLRNVRKLLRSGGYLVVFALLPPPSIFFGVIFGALQYSRLEPLTKWDKLLRVTGFSGIDTSTSNVDSLAPCSVFVSQAVDEQVSFLRDPFSLASPPPTMQMQIQDLVILGGSSLAKTKLTNQLSETLRPYCGNIQITSSMVDFLNADLSPDTAILSLVDLEISVFKDLTDTDWNALKKMLLHTGTLMWVTQGRLANDPYANMIVGLIRGASRDNPALEYLLLDIEDIDRIDHHTIVGALLRHRATSHWRKQDSINITVEKEIVLDKRGRSLIPRLKMNDEMNSRYNSNRQEIRSRIQPGPHNMGISESNLGWDIEIQPPFNCFGDGIIPLRTNYSFQSPIRVSQRGCMFVIFGKDETSGDNFIALSSQNSSLIRPQKELSSAIKVPASPEPQLLWLVAHHLLASAILRELQKDDKVLIYGSSSEFASIIAEEAKLLGVQLTSITTNVEASKMHDPNWFVVSPTISERVLAGLVQEDLSSFVDMTSRTRKDSCGDRIATLLPNHCRRDNYEWLVGTSAWNPTTPYLKEINSRLTRAVTWASAVLDDPTRCGEQVPTVTLDSFPLNYYPQMPLTVIDWSRRSEVSIKVCPIESQVSFHDNKTYWLVGLTGGLGLSLCEWMSQREARYFVLSSRNPNVEAAWLGEMRTKGVTVKISKSFVLS